MNTGEEDGAIYEGVGRSGIDEVELGEALEQTRDFVRRYVVVSTDALLAIALWIFHTHAFAACEETAYLQITSPQKQCGKTRLLEVLDLLVANPWKTSKTSAAALVRKIAKDKPTLLLDETDAAFRSGDEYAESLRGILDAGHRRDGKTSLCVGKTHKVEDFDVFCPKALAGIGTLPDTIADRSIRIELQRRRPEEQVRRLRRRLIGNEADALRRRLAELAQAAIEQLRDADPDQPNELSDRAQDGWEPLLAIAEAANIGGAAHAAAIALSRQNDADEADLGLRALRDVRRLFFERPEQDRFSSVDLVAALGAIEDGPYGPSKGQPFSARTLAKRLKPYGIKPGSIKFPPDGTNVKGYLKSWFADAWARYTPSTTDEVLQNHRSAGELSVVEKPLNGTATLYPVKVGGSGGKPYEARVSSVVCEGGRDDVSGGPEVADHRNHRDHRLSRCIEDNELSSERLSPEPSNGRAPKMVI